MFLKSLKKFVLEKFKNCVFSFEKPQYCFESDFVIENFLDKIFGKKSSKNEIFKLFQTNF